MDDICDFVVGMVALNGGKMVGKTRLQKSFFFLEQCGMNSSTEFDYHNFGPFSAEVATALDDAVAIGLLAVEERRGYHSVPYSLYTTSQPAPTDMGFMSSDEVMQKLKVMANYSALELEVAATIVYLRENGFGARAIEETKLRKPIKATAERVARALSLIQELGL